MEGKAGEGETAERRAASARPAVDASIGFAVLVLVCTVLMLDLIGFLLGALPQLISATAFRCCGDRRLGSGHVRGCLISACFFACLGFVWYAAVSILETVGFSVFEWFVGSNVIVVQGPSGEVNILGTDCSGCAEAAEAYAWIAFVAGWLRVACALSAIVATSVAIARLRELRGPVPFNA